MSSAIQNFEYKWSAKFDDIATQVQLDPEVKDYKLVFMQKAQEEIVKYGETYSSSKHEHPIYRIPCKEYEVLYRLKEKFYRGLTR